MSNATDDSKALDLGGLTLRLSPPTGADLIEFGKAMSKQLGPRRATAGRIARQLYTPAGLRVYVALLARRHHPFITASALSSFITPANTGSVLARLAEASNEPAAARR